MTQFVKVAFEVEVEEGDEYPSSIEIINALQGGLPKEWWADHREAYWGLVAIYALNHDGTLEQSDARLRPANVKVALAREVAANALLRAEVAQERKLTAHLDGQVANLTEKNDNQVTIINNYKTNLAARYTEIADLKHELAIEKGLGRELQVKYDDSLIDWKAIQKQRDDAITRADRNLRRYDDANDLNKGLVAGREAFQAELAKANGEAQAHANMIGKIVDAMEGAGYDVSGWGNDVELEELETAIGGVTNGLEDASSEASIITQKLDEIRTRR